MKYRAFVGPSYTSQSGNAAIERLVNLYPEAMESEGAKVRYALYPAPGLEPYSALSASPVRGMFAQDGRMWAVGATGLFEVTETGLSAVGAVLQDRYPATFCSNGDGGDQVLVTSGDSAYVLDRTSNVLTLAVTGARVGAFLDGYFLVLDAATSTLAISDLLDGLTWNPTQIAQRSAGADQWQSMIVSHRDLWLFGSESTEIWTNQGLYPFPFAPAQGGLIKMGIAAPFSVAMLDNTPVWLGKNSAGEGIVCRGNGYGLSRISTHAVEFAIQGYETIDDAVAFAYQDQGHSFYVLSFPSADTTWVYDAATGFWHERLYWDGAAASFTAYRPQFHCFAFGKHLVGDRASGLIYDMDVTFGADADETPIRRVRRLPHLTSERDLVVFHELELDLESGLGLSSGQGSDPTVMLRYSDDGGKTWSNERWTSAGVRGAYHARVAWSRLGAGRNRVFEVVMTDPIPWRLADCYVDLSAGIH